MVNYQLGEALGMSERNYLSKCIGFRTYSHAFGLAEFNGTIHFALQGQNRIAQSP